MERPTRPSPTPAYGGVYRLARRVTAGARTPYDAVSAIETYLNTRYRYSEFAPIRHLALRTFLLGARRGYCQHFSGAMALMLRMVGDPGPRRRRVQPREAELGRRLRRHRLRRARVGRDLLPGDRLGHLRPDAGRRPGAVARERAGLVDRVLGRPEQVVRLLELRQQPAQGLGGRAQRGLARVRPRPAPTAPPDRRRPGAAGRRRYAPGRVGRWRRRRALRSEDLADAQLREVAAALERVRSWRIRGATLLGLERRLAAEVGPGSAAYVARIRAAQYAPGDNPPPGMSLRGVLRRELASGRGLRPAAAEPGGDSAGRPVGAGCKPPFRRPRGDHGAARIVKDSSGPGGRGHGSDRGRDTKAVEKATRRGNYDSGSDYVLEYGELRFSFNEDDFAQRVEQAAVKLDFVDQGLGGDELTDLLELAVNGEIREPTSSLGEHINEHWTELVGPASRSLVHWIRRLVFRGAWLDQRVKEGELDIVFDPETQSFGYVQPERDSEPIELSREPSWARLAYRR